MGWKVGRNVGGGGVKRVNVEDEGMGKGMPFGYHFDVTCAKKLGHHSEDGVKELMFVCL